MQFDFSLLFLVAPIIGLTAALTSMFPKTLGSVKPFVAFAVAGLMYFAWKSLPSELYGLLISVGSAMGLYEIKKG